MTVETVRFEECALLKAKGFRFVGAQSNGRRVVLSFDDPTGEARELLARHAASGVQVNSQAFENGLLWAKNQVFGVRRD